jgi:hypothetical protein
MTEVEEHWHSKSSVAQFALVTAADSMQDEAQSGTASALAWQGDSESQVSVGPAGSVVGGSVVVGSSSVVVSSSSSGSVGVGVGVGVGSSSGSGTAVATQPQTAAPASIAEPMASKSKLQPSRTQGTAVSWIFSELVGSQRQATSVAPHPTSAAALVTQGSCYSVSLWSGK